MTIETTPRPLYVIAKDIRKDLTKVYSEAKPYLDAMGQLDNIKDKFYFDSGESVVRYFLANASSWRGPKAREIKAELKAMLQNR